MLPVFSATSGQENVFFKVKSSYLMNMEAKLFEQNLKWVEYFRTIIFFLTVPAVNPADNPRAAATQTVWFPGALFVSL